MLDHSGRSADEQGTSPAGATGREPHRRRTLRRVVPAVAGITTAVAAAFLPAPELGSGEPDGPRPWQGSVPFEVAERPHSEP